MSNKNWTDITEANSRFASFEKVHSTEGTQYRYLLEEVNKGWDRPHNWVLSIFAPDGDAYTGWADAPVWQEKFYLNMHHNTPQQAQHMSDTTLTVEAVKAINELSA